MSSPFRSLFPALARCPGSAVVLALAAALGACGRGTGEGSEGFVTRSGRLQGGLLPGDELVRPGGGGTFFLDPNQGGEGTGVRLLEVAWGRLVDVHDTDPEGQPSAEPRFRDLVVGQGVQTDGVDYTLTTHPITQKSRLVIHARKGTPRFERLLRAARENLAVIEPRSDDGSSAPPFSTAPRNACLVLRFDDCLRDDAAAEQALAETVRTRVGYPPEVPFGARMRFDPNHGGLVGGAFHSTRVLVDLAVSELEAASMPVPQPINPLGLPASLSGSSAPNVSVRIPTALDPGSGQFRLLTNLAGVPLTAGANTFVDLTAPTQDVVRALRSGNPEEPNRGFLIDDEPPRLVGDLPLVIERVETKPNQDLLLDLVFSSGCRLTPEKLDVVTAGDAWLAVVASEVPDANGRIRKLRVHPAAPVPDPSALLGSGVLHAVYGPARQRGLPLACWIGFSPAPPAPGIGVSTDARVLVRFSEAMDPEPLRELDDLALARGSADSGTASATTLVPGEVSASAGLDVFAFQPQLPLAHVQGSAEVYHVELGAARDLAGNVLLDALPFVDFRLEPSQPTRSTGGLVLRFDSLDEIGPDGAPDVRGAFFFDPDRGALRPRPVTHTSWVVDRINPVPSIMIPYPFGIFLPLTPLGSKVHEVWRYCDLAWNVHDETKYDLDVSGLSWAPLGGIPIADFYPQFEIRLAHSHFLPDESVDNNLLPRWLLSGLVGDPSPFTDNILDDPVSPQKVVHPKALGYMVDPTDLFAASSGTLMMPYPLNRGTGTPITYTWRDTAVLARAGPDNQGIPMDIEVGPPLNLEPSAGTIAAAGQVPSIGLPLLIEYRCYPTDAGVGLNRFDISLAINSSALPAFRSYSAGGVDTSGNAVIVNPDTELVPHGGFNPSSIPPGLPTQLSSDNVFSIGQLDTVTRLSRAHTIWIDAGPGSAPEWQPALLAPSVQPAGTAIRLDYRSASGFGGMSNAPFDANALNAYGDEAASPPTAPPVDLTSWSSDIASADGQRYLQVRLTFVSDIETDASPLLSVLALGYQEN